MVFHLLLPVYPPSLALPNSEITCDTLYLSIASQDFFSAEVVSHPLRILQVTNVFPDLVSYVELREGTIR
jgi:hypothetical protein